jgi:hypothetical protein
VVESTVKGIVLELPFGIFGTGGIVTATAEAYQREETLIEPQEFKK